MPKTFRHLWPQLVSFENLWHAYLSARRGKRARPGVASYELEAETRLLRLQEQLDAGEYVPGAYRTFVIREWKRRVVSAAPFEDRIVHHALCRVIEPIWEARFIHDTYACRRGKGTLAALDRAQHFARGHRYVLQIDIREFFPSIDHVVLESTLSHHIADTRVLNLCRQIIASGRDVLAEEYTPHYFAGDDLFAPARSTNRQSDLAILGERVPAPARSVHQARVTLRRVCALLRRLAAVPQRQAHPTRLEECST